VCTEETVMGDAPLIVGVSGLRGIVGQSLTPEVAVRYGRALAWWLGRDREGPFRVALGRDGRAGGEMFEHAVASALLASGVDVVRTGPVTTPTMAVVVDGGSGDTFDAGVMVTASHNPQRWNGLKLIGGAEDGACAPKASDAAALVEAFESGRSLASGTVGFEAELDGAFLDHARAVWTSVVTHEGGDFTGRTIVVDSVNCAGADGADMLWGGSGARLIQLCGDGSGVFPHTPEPTAENLSGEGGLCATRCRG
jgi:phosphomannomutase